MRLSRFWQKNARKMDLCKAKRFSLKPVLFLMSLYFFFNLGTFYASKSCQQFPAEASSDGREILSENIFPRQIKEAPLKQAMGTPDYLENIHETFVLKTSGNNDQNKIMTDQKITKENDKTKKDSSSVSKDKKFQTSKPAATNSSSSSQYKNKCVDFYCTGSYAHHAGLKRWGWSSVSRHSFKSPFIAEPHVYSSKTITKAPGYRKKKLIACYNCPQRFFISNHYNSDFKQCPYSECELSVESGMNYNATMMLFWQDPETDPPKRPKGQLWAFLTWEAPPNRGYPKSRYKWRDQFNYTITYLRESDFYLPYDNIVWRDEALIKPDEYYVEAAKRKTRMAAWWVSHCSTSSNRRAYVDEMRKYIHDIDIFGTCGNLTCEKAHNDDCWKQLNTTYRFYLSFENTYCPDYVTEKFFRMFRYRFPIIPVVRGGFNYEKYFPKNTFINTANFVSAKDLAHYLMELAKDPVKLGKLYKEKDRVGILNRKMDWCDFCEKLHTGGFKKQIIHDVRDYSYERPCWKAPNDIK